MRHIYIVGGMLALAAVGITGCGSRTTPPPVEPSPVATSKVETSASPTPAAALSGEDAFLAEARRLEMGAKDFGRATDAQLMRIGCQICRVFDTQEPPTPEDRQIGFEVIVQTVALSTQAPEVSARRLVTAAVVHLCPWNGDVFPSV